MAKGKLWDRGKGAYMVNIDYERIFAEVDRITTLPLERKGNKWYGRCYLDGREAKRRDKTVVVLTRNSIKMLEQGGEVMSIAKWLVNYGGCLDYREAYSRLRGETACTPKREVVFRKEKPKKYIPRRILDAHLSDIFKEEDVLRNVLGEMFGGEEVLKAYLRYNVTPSQNGATCFWYVDREGRVCHENIISYLETGKRDKEKRAWRKFKVGQGYTGRCYFGEHLLEGKDFKKVYLLEGEKSAVIMSLMFPQHLFLATGGMNNLREIQPEWILLPDYDAYTHWSSRFPEQTVRWWESFPDYEVGEKDDIVDYYLQ